MPVDLLQLKQTSIPTNQQYWASIKLLNFLLLSAKHLHQQNPVPDTNSVHVHTTYIQYYKTVQVTSTWHYDLWLKRVPIVKPYEARQSSRQPLCVGISISECKQKHHIPNNCLPPIVPVDYWQPYNISNIKQAPRSEFLIFKFEMAYNGALFRDSNKTPKKITLK